MKASDKSYIQRLVADKAGIELGDEKSYLMESRLKSLAEEEGYEGVEALIDKVRKTERRELIGKVVGALTTNESYFFRDEHPFESLKDEVLPTLFEEKRLGETVRVWSAACSRGQEPYSVAMLVREHFPSEANNVEVIASDISGEMLAEAKAGKYSREQIERGLPDKYRKKYFDKFGDKWVVNDDVKRMVRFHQINLVDSFGFIPKSDIIFLRYVLTYFDDETKEDIFERVEQKLKDGGYLILGGTEMVMNLNFPFDVERIGQTRCYRPKN